MSSREQFPHQARATRAAVNGQSAIFAMIYGAASHNALPTLREFDAHQKRRQFFAACRGCGNPARNGHCFKCKQKEKAGDESSVLVVVEGTEADPSSPRSQQMNRVVQLLAERAKENE